MSTTPTTNYGWLKPVPGTETDTWGADLNTIFDAQDALVKTIETTANNAQPKSIATVVGGTGDAITVTFSPVFTSYSTQMRFRFSAGAANTITNPTINVDSLGIKNIKKLNNQALAVGDIPGAGAICECTYDGTSVILLNPGADLSKGGGTMAGPIVLSADGAAVLNPGSVRQVQNGVVAHATVVGGTVDAITATFSPVFAAYVTNMRVRFTAGGANTLTNPTINVDGLGVKTIKKGTGIALAIGDIIGSGHVCELVYNGTDMLLQNPNPLSASNFATNLQTQAMTSTALSVPPAGLALLHRGYIDGLTMTTDALNTVTVAAGVAIAETNDYFMVLSSSLAKGLNATWVVGAGGGLDTGAEAASTWYHVFLIARPDTGVVDVLLSTSLTPTMPTNYTKRRRIGSIRNDASSNILQFSQNGDEFLWAASVVDVNVLNPGTAAVLRALTVPTGVKVIARFSAGMYGGSSTPISARFSSPDVSDQALQNPGTSSLTGAASMSGLTNNAGGGWLLVPHLVRTDTSAQIRTRMQISGASDRIGVITEGWIDLRGTDA